MKVNFSFLNNVSAMPTQGLAANLEPPYTEGKAQLHYQYAYLVPDTFLIDPNRL